MNIYIQGFYSQNVIKPNLHKLILEGEIINNFTRHPTTTSTLLNYFQTKVIVQ